jgi:hypothetical protein
LLNNCVALVNGRYVGVGVVNVYSGSMNVDGRTVPVPMVAYVVPLSQECIDANTKGE